MRTRLLIQVWEETGFAVPVQNRNAPGFMREIDPWEIEAVGASDDPSRFHVDMDAESVAAEVPELLQRPAL